jgi:hypothetical protein
MARWVAAAAALCGLSGSTGAAAQESEAPPDIDFLEYLGSWQADDEEWLVIAEGQRGAESAERRGREPPAAAEAGGEAPPQKDDDEDE